MIDKGNRPLQVLPACLRHWVVPVVGIWLAISAVQATEPAPEVLAHESFLNALELAWGLEQSAASLQHTGWSADHSDRGGRTQLAALQLDERIFQARFEPRSLSPQSTPTRLEATRIPVASEESSAADGVFRRLVAVALGLGLIVLAAANSRKRRPTINFRGTH